jgi:hypothetical protein
MPKRVGTSAFLAVFLLLLLGALLGLASPEAEEPPGEIFLSGYEADVRGDVLEYNSADPDVISALLVRSLSAERYIEWKTETVPDSSAATASFVWLFGMDASPERHRFTLSVNGAETLDFRNPEVSTSEPWTVTGRNGARLTFRGTVVDRHGDHFGYALLRLPAADLPRGKPVTLRLTGESAGSRIWAMTFRSRVEAGMSLHPLPAAIRQDGQTLRLLELTICRLAEEAPARIEVPGSPPLTETLRFGSNRIRLRIPEVEEETEVVVRVTEGGGAREIKAVVAPARPWHVDLVQYTHTDVGYTRPQTQILPEHVRYLDLALDLCDRTDGLPEDARFRWTCEGSWAVREFLRTRPAQEVERLKRRVAEGRIELTALFLNMSEVTDEATCAALLQPLREIRAAGLPVTSAMQNDVNGAAWCLVDLLPDIGVRYLSMGQHGHRALVPFDRPTAFWWESPAGSRVLAFRSDHYHTGNFWGIHTGNFDAVERELFRYLSSLVERGYPLDRIAVPFSGSLTDNSPPSKVVCNLVVRWNEKYAWPRLRVSTAGDFLEHVEQRHGEDLPTYRVAWPDWWMDGLGSAARETAVARGCQEELATVRTLLAFYRLLGVTIPDRLLDESRRIADDLLFYGEHTFGAAESVREPLAENTMVQWGQKSAYAWEAAKSTSLLREATLGLVTSLVPPREGPVLVAFNPRERSHTSLVRIVLDHTIVPGGSDFRILDPEGKALEKRLLEERPEARVYLVRIPEVPAFSLRAYPIEIGPAGDAGLETTPPRKEPAAPVLENDFYRVELDPVTGALKSLVDKELGRELVDREAPWGFGQVIHETLADREQLEHFKLERGERTAIRDIAWRRGDPGPLWQSLVVTGESDSAVPKEGVRMEVRLHHEDKLLELCYSVRKKQVFDPEALYVSLPFLSPEGRVHYEAQGARVGPETDLLPGTSADWQAIQGYASVLDAKGQILLASPEVPLVQLGNLNLGRFEKVLRIERPHVYSWVMNNYWTTNFRAGQQGEFRWRYLITSTSDTSASAAQRFGESVRRTMPCRVLPSGGTGKGLGRIASCFPLPDNLLLVQAWPASDGNGVVLHFRECEGRRTRIDLGASTTSREDDPAGGSPRILERLNVLEESLGALEGELEIGAHEVVFVRMVP